MNVLENTFWRKDNFFVEKLSACSRFVICFQSFLILFSKNQWTSVVPHITVCFFVFRPAFHASSSAAASSSSSVAPPRDASQLISNNSTHSTHITQLNSHTTPLTQLHLTQFSSPNSSHTTHLTQLTSLNRPHRTHLT